MNINCLCCSVGTAVDCVVICGHDLFVSVVLIDVGMLYTCVHVCSRAETLYLFVRVLGGVWSSIKTPGSTCHTSLGSCHSGLAPWVAREDLASGGSNYFAVIRCEQTNRVTTLLSKPTNMEKFATLSAIASLPWPVQRN